VGAGQPSTVPTVSATETSDPETSDPETSDPATPAAVRVDAWHDITANLVGLVSTCGNVSYLAADPISDLVYVDVARYGLFSLAADATTWSPIGQAGDPIDHRTQWIEFDPEVPTRFWVSGAYGDGVFRTDDGGVSFERLGDVAHVDRVAVDMTDPDRLTLLAGSHEDRLLWRSIDGGETWTDISPSLPLGVGFSSVPVILGTDTYLLGTYRGEASGILRSDDGGLTWTRVFDDDVVGGPIVTDDYIAWNRGTGSGGVAVSVDGGLTFASSGVGPGRPSPTLVHGPGGTLATTSEAGIVLTPDLGQTWSEVGDPLPFEPDGVGFSSARGTFYAWWHSCSFGEEGNPVVAGQIVQATVTENG
jgi:hypothetical protein